jgi:hypothetical protein
MLKIRKWDLIVSIYIFCVVVAELMGGKTFDLIHLGKLNLSASVAIFLLPVTFAINDIIVEVKGKARAQSLVRSSIIVIALIVIFSLLAVSLPPTSRFAATEVAYDTIFKISIRFSIASLVAFALAEILDVLIFYRLRQNMGKKNLWLRTNLSNFISQFIDTTTFIVLAFYALDKPIGQNLSFIFGLVLPYWLLKCVMSIIETPFVYLGVSWLRKGNDED